MDKLSLPVFEILTPLRRALLVRMTKMCKSYIFRLLCLSGLTMLVNVKMIEIANRIKIARFTLHRSRARIPACSVSFNVESEGGEIKAVKHFIFDNCFTIELLND